MSLRHRITAGLGAVTLGAVGLFTLPGVLGVAAADTCTPGVTSTAAAARALQGGSYDLQYVAALAHLESQALTGGGWSSDGSGRPDVAATAAVLAALPTAPSPGRDWLESLQRSGALFDPRAAADALPGLVGTKAGQDTADWLLTQLKDMNDDQDFDHLETDGAVDHELTVDAVLGWNAVGVAGSTGAVAATDWLGRHADEYLHPADPDTLDVEAAAKLILVTSAADDAVSEFGPAQVRGLVAELEAAQVDDGTFSDDVAVHALAIRALATEKTVLDEVTEGGADRVLADATEALVAQECTGGGYPVVFRDVSVPTTPSTTSSSPGSSTPSSSPSVSLIPPTSRSSEPTDGLQLDLDSIAAGSPVSISVNGFQPNERVRIELHSTPVVLGYLQVDSRGSGSAVVTIPRDAVPGLHEVWVIGESSDIRFSRTVTITPYVEQSTIVVEPTRRAASGAKLSATGATVSPALAGAAGGLLLLAGAGLLTWTRRRTAAQH